MNENVIIEPAVLNYEELGPFEFFRKLNSTRPKDHSANRLYEDKNGKVVAVRCNCGKKKYHLVVEGPEIYWDESIIPSEFSGLRKKERVLTL